MEIVLAGPPSEVDLWLRQYPGRCLGDRKNDRGGIIGMKEPLRLLEDIPNTTRSLLGIVTDVTIKSEQAREYLEN